MKATHLLAIVGISVLAIGCGGDKPQPKTPEAAGVPSAPPLTPEQARAVDAAQAESGAGGLRYDEEILRLCPDVAFPKFDYDSARVKEAFRNSMVALAQCLREGGLKDRSLLLVGHADPRGEEDYNLALGGRRAGAVRDALGSLGVAGSRLDVSSRGELEAKGTDESTWADDRRVDVKLAGR